MNMPINNRKWLINRFIVQKEREKEEMEKNRK